MIAVISFNVQHTETPASLSRHFIIIIIIVAWSRTVAPLRDLWQPQQTIALTGGFRFRHLRELDPPRCVEVCLDDDSSSDPVSCLLLCRLPVAVQRLQGLLDRAVRCGRKWTGAGVSGIESITDQKLRAHCAT